MDGSCLDYSGSRRSGPAEDRAQPAEDRSRRTGGGFGPTTSIRNAGRAFTNQMTAETLRVRADLACVIYVCMGRYDHPEVALTLFRSTDFKVMPFNHRFERRNKRDRNFRCCILALNSTILCCCLTAVSRLDRVFIEHPRL